MNTSLSLILPDEAATLRFGQCLAQWVEAPMVIYLYGELGAGKTTLVRALLQSLGYEDSVKSPSYTLVEEYRFAQFELFHFDLYRIKNQNELLNMGFSDYMNERSVCLIEWPALASSLLPADIEIKLEVLTEGRQLKLSSSSAALQQKLKQCV